MSKKGARVEADRSLASSERYKVCLGTGAVAKLAHIVKSSYCNSGHHFAGLFHVQVSTYL